MEANEYETMYHREEDHWWYVGLHDLVLTSLRTYCAGRSAVSLLDAGCGTGKLLAQSPVQRGVGVELSSHALPYLRRRELANVVQGTVSRLPFADGVFDVVVSLDVLCCVRSPGDLHALRELGRVLRPDGLLLLNLPAYPALRSHHDSAVHIQQRYTRRGLRALLADAGLHCQVLTYRNTILFPIAGLVRGWQKLFQKAPDEPRSDLRPMPDLVNRLLTYPLVLEKKWIQAGLRLPFGLSLYCQAAKAGGPT